MSSLLDNMTVIRLLSELTTPIEKTDAFKLGVIDKNLNVLVSAKDRNKQQEDSYDYFHRFGFSLRKILSKLPGGKSQIATLSAALFLVKDTDAIKSPNIEEELQLISNSILASKGTFIEESNFIKECLYIVEDDVATNHTGDAVSTDVAQPIKSVARRKFAEFEVDEETFGKFSKGKKKFEQWKNYLNLEDESHQEIYKYAKRHPKGILILKNGDNIKALRFNRNGGGNWHTRKRGKNDKS